MAQYAEERIAFDETAFEAQQAAQQAQASLSKRVETLAALIPAGVADQNGVKTLLEGVKRDVATQSNATEKMMQYIPYEARRTRAAAALADKVFGTPELLERILLSVNTFTAFYACYTVSKTFKNTIQGSLKLQRKLGLQRDIRAELSLKARGLITPHSGLRLDMHAVSFRETQAGPKMEAELLIGGRAHEAKKPGSRLRSVQLTQPPMQNLKAYVLCCSGSHVRRYPPYRPVSMHNQSGITIGELYDKLVLLRKAHGDCASAEIGDHDEEGVVHPRVRFNAVLALREDDYAVLHERETEEKMMRSKAAADAFEQKLRPYMQAKEAGKLGLNVRNPYQQTSADYLAAQRFSLTIPTYAVWKAERERRARAALAEEAEEEG